MHTCMGGPRMSECTAKPMIICAAMARARCRLETYHSLLACSAYATLHPRMPLGERRLPIDPIDDKFVEENLNMTSLRVRRVALDAGEAEARLPKLNAEACGIVSFKAMYRSSCWFRASHTERSS